MQTEIHLKPYQSKFISSTKRFPSIIAGIGTGKTMMLLMKLWHFCETYPDSLAWIIRKEYTDLRDSTVRDFERYFNVKVDSRQNYEMPNGSVICFRHGKEVTPNVLKNVNLSIVGIEQAEEFETETEFTYLRDRLRRDNCPYHQLCIIGNARGHNWIWKLWKNNPRSEEYDLYEACTFDNEDNLPEDFIKDLRAMKVEAPNHYSQFVMNNWEEMESDDYLFTFPILEESMKLELPDERSKSKVLGVDVARFGNDETVFTVLEQVAPYSWHQTFIETHRQKDLMWTVGRIIDIRRELNIDAVIVDDDGLGGGVTDRLKQLNINVYPFKGGEKANDFEEYANRRAEGFFELKQAITKGNLRISNNHSAIDQLLTIKYKYTGRNLKAIVSKDVMKKEGLKSPDMADALMMAWTGVGKTAKKMTFIPQGTKSY